MSDPVKMIYLMKRRQGVSRDELAMHWFANHMPDVIANMNSARDSGRDHAKKYTATLFSGVQAGDWDGMANLWWDNPLPEPETMLGDPPRDTFQQKVEPYRPWATREFPALDGELPVDPLTLNDPFPCTRSGFTKLNMLVRAKPGVDFEKMFTHWVEVHAPNASGPLKDYGCFRYVLSLSVSPETEEFAGLGEIYFEGNNGLERFQEFREAGVVEPDGFGDYTDADNMQMYVAYTEMIGIP